MGQQGSGLQLQIKGQLSRQDFENGYFLMRKMVSPLHLPRVQGGLCLTGAALCATMIPTSLTYFGNLWGPVGGILFFLLLTGLFGWVIPSLTRSHGAWMFTTNRTLSLPYTMSIFPDHFVWENPHERVLAYWTDVHRCLENKRYYVLTGDLEKPLLVIQKAGLSTQECGELSRIFQKAVAGRYRQG